MFSVSPSGDRAIGDRLVSGFADGLTLASAVRLGATALAGEGREIPNAELEVGVLARGNGRRCFHRLTDAEIGAQLAG